MVTRDEIDCAKADMKLCIAFNLCEIHQDSADYDKAAEASQRIEAAIVYLEKCGYEIKYKELMA
jgi:hypothetical protein